MELHKVLILYDIQKNLKVREIPSSTIKFRNKMFDVRCMTAVSTLLVRMLIKRAH